jgi:hypothetical protein
VAQLRPLIVLVANVLKYIIVYDMQDGVGTFDQLSHYLETLYDLFVHKSKQTHCTCTSAVLITNYS